MTNETPRRTVRVPEERWNDAMRFAAMQDPPTTVSEIVNDALDRFIAAAAAKAVSR